MAARTSSPVRTSSHRSISAPRRSLALAALGLVSLVIGGLALRSASAEEPAASASSLQSDLIGDLKDALIAGQGAVIELSKGKRSGGSDDGDDSTTDRRSTVDNAKVAALARKAAEKVASAGKRVGSGITLAGLDTAQTDLEGVATRAAVAKSGSKDWAELRETLTAEVATLEGSVADAESQADTAATSSYESYFLAGVLAFVFLNFGLLVVQTLRSQKTPKIVLDTLTTSASFLIGAGASSWVS